ncbi:HET-domain-containing protein, partial [Trametes versicolor FP-101664 SS1]|uniref:HET-domain-containing protein n=1 Tax=Trametes versicolor (strain FP-101664) TaxID=717944 RepID=UPI0004622BE9
SYLALSYVWGEPQPHSTIMSNVSAYTRGIEPSRLPQTIRDAIQVTHALGFQYLWLDTLCIIQDSDDDRQHELAQMHAIYRNAYLTIIAASARRVSEGFLQERLPNDPPPIRHGEVSPDIRHLPFICPPPLLSPARAGPSMDAELYNHTWEPISTRAWCMQEYMMSPRALLFTSQTLQFRCQTTTKNVGDSFYSPGPSEPLFPTSPGEEGGERRLPNALFLPSPPPLEWQNSYAWLEVHEAWLRLVQDYTRCALTVPADKLPACGALAAQFHRVLRTDYLAGLWREMLLNDLLWQRQRAAALRAPAAYRAPSWSWAALDGPIGMRKREPGQTALASVVRCDVVLEDAALPFGQVKGGTLVLR